MRVMLDTNVIISASLNPTGQAAQALLKALSPPFEPLVCSYVVEELHRKFCEKFPKRQTELESFLFNLLLTVQLVPTPTDVLEVEEQIRDMKDRPILRSALDAHADIFLTGDKDFLESAVTDPRIMSVADFLLL